MGRKLQTIYEYFSDYSIQEIDEMIDSLTEEEQLLIKDRYGEDLNNPKTSKNWCKEKENKFYRILVPKMRKILSKQIECGENKEEDKPIISIQQQKTEVVDFSLVLLDLLKERKTNKEICDILDINSEKLYEELLKLKNKGIAYSRKYYSDASIKYGQILSIQELKQYNSVLNQDKTIITDSHENNIKALVISDLHFGNEFQRLDLINRVYNYCIKNGINIILCGGDLIDGRYTKTTQNISDVYKQVEYFIKNYPHDSSILTFAVAGDHDMSALYRNSLNIIDACNNFRHDIIIGGYNNTSINIKNDKVHLFHHIESGNLIHNNAPIILHGHCHKFTTEFKNNSLNVTIPTLSNINQIMPSALELNLNFDKGYISNSEIKHLYFGDQDIILSESRHDFSKTLNKHEPVKNVECYIEKSLEKNVEQKVLTKTNDQLSQIEKFNRRYER